MSVMDVVFNTYNSIFARFFQMCKPRTISQHQRIIKNKYIDLIVELNNIL